MAQMSRMPVLCASSRRDIGIFRLLGRAAGRPGEHEMRSLSLAALLIAAPVSAVAQQAPAAETQRVATDPTAERAEASMRALLVRMEAAWNRGDFEGYMAGFANPGVVFVSNGRIQNGWQGALEHY